MGFTILKIVLIVLAGMFYYMVMKTINARLKKGSRVAQFKVGGRRRHEEDEELSREERQASGKVSLRDGPRLRRRFK